MSCVFYVYNNNVRNTRNFKFPFITIPWHISITILMSFSKYLLFFFKSQIIEKYIFSIYLIIWSFLTMVIIFKIFSINLVFASLTFPNLISYITLKCVHHASGLWWFLTSLMVFINNIHYKISQNNLICIILIYTIVHNCVSNPK
jgi:hypothetical protein